ncbi:MAG: T9SS type A sorting domain-containing protein [Saprospiraceae bacterium]|nr:T9SS type A sorting domain-containing protein [Saprospiraceae bacterium]
MKNIIAVPLFLLISQMTYAQVKFNLGYAETTHTYTLSIVPQTTWESPKNMVNSAQIVLRIDAGSEFTPAITSLVEGLTWADNAYVEHPDGDPEHTFVCISLVNGPTSLIKMIAGEEVPLFSFVNVAGGCAGAVTLLANDAPAVLAVRSAGYNVTQHFAVLGARKNAFTGFENATVECAAVTGADELAGKLVDEVKVSPVPADKTATIQWNLLSDMQGAGLIRIFDAQGREVFQEKNSGGTGWHTLQLNVQNWQPGLYRIQFEFDQGQRTKSWNMMVIH